MEKKNVYLLVASADDANVCFFGSQLVEVIEKQEERIADIRKSGNLERFAQEAYAHSQFIVSNIERIPFNLRLQYLNFAVMCCLHVLDRPRHLRLKNVSLTTNVDDILEQLTLLVDDCR